MDISHYFADYSLPVLYSKNETILKVENLGMQYGDKVILDNINFEIKNIIRPSITQGQIISIVGKSGCGKTTLFRSLAGLTQPTTGRVLVNSTLEPVEPGDVGIVTQNYILFNHRTVRQNLLLSIKKNKNIPKEQYKDVIEHYANAFDISDHIEKYPMQLSGGQRQRVSIARQLLNGCNFILFDEPFSGLDVLMVEKVTNILINVSLSDELKTLIIVSHDLENALSISDTVIVLGKNQGATGSTVKAEIDLIERGLAWSKDVKFTPNFKNTINEIKSLL